MTAYEFFMEFEQLLFWAGYDWERSFTHITMLLERYMNLNTIKMFYSRDELPTSYEGWKKALVLVAKPQEPQTELQLLPTSIILQSPELQSWILKAVPWVETLGQTKQHTPHQSPSWLPRWLWHHVQTLGQVHVH